jgi:hypothetical protein
LRSFIRIGNSYLNEHIKSGKLDTRDEVFLDETEMGVTDIVYAV